MKKMVLLAAGFAGAAAFAQQPGGGRGAFLERQAYEEVQRVAGQVDVVESNLAALSDRVARIERGGGEIAAVKAEVDALRAEINRVRAEMQVQRKEIVDDLLKRIKPMMQQQQSARQQPPPPQDFGPQEEYTVRPGDTLSLISQAFGTTVGRLKEMNGLKGDNLRVGQKIRVPAQSQGGKGGRRR